MDSISMRDSLSFKIIASCLATFTNQLREEAKLLLDFLFDLREYRFSNFSSALILNFPVRREKRMQETIQMFFNFADLFCAQNHFALRLCHENFEYEILVSFKNHIF